MKASRANVWEFCILAGGLSQRMGRDKSRLKLGGRTMLGQIRVEARKLGWPVRVIRRDAVPRCGPLGGVLTALKTSRADAVLFLACDMPLVTAGLLRRVIGKFGDNNRALFVRSKDATGFPFALKREAIDVVVGQIDRRDFSLHALARVLKAKTLRPPLRLRAQLQNVNTPEELDRLHRWWDGLVKPVAGKK